MKRYSVEIEQSMKSFYDSLSEKEQRRYAVVEAQKFGHGGQSYVAKVLGCHRRTIWQGRQEQVEKGGDGLGQRIRRVGGGRPKYDKTHPHIHKQFLAVIEQHTAGSPMDETIVWTDLGPTQIAQLLQQEYGVKVSKTVIYQLLQKHHYRRRQAEKKLTMKQVAFRDEQFERIAQLRAEYEASPDNPIISLDSKKKRIFRQLLSSRAII